MNTCSWWYFETPQPQKQDLTDRKTDRQIDRQDHMQVFYLLLQRHKWVKTERSKGSVKLNVFIIFGGLFLEPLVRKFPYLHMMTGWWWLWWWKWRASQRGQNNLLGQFRCPLVIQFCSVLFSRAVIYWWWWWCLFSQVWLMLMTWARRFDRHLKKKKKKTLPLDSHQICTNVWLWTNAKC